jgi:hypothetical protein
MSFEYLIDPAKGPQRKGVLPGKPRPFVQDFPGMGAAAQLHNIESLQDFDRSGRP